jgi:maltooligosyltrehalose trehalohydrolase
LTPSPLTPGWHPSLGAVYLGDGNCRFRVWAPRARRVEVHLLHPADRLVSLTPTASGYHEITLTDVPAGATYFYRIDGKRERPDPVSRHQTRGVHGPSSVVDPAFPWTDSAWHGLPFADLVIYELHVGTYTPEGTFDALIPHLDGLRDLGINALELMPLAQTPGVRNWGYDGVQLFAPRHDYGGPAGLKRLVDAAHARGMAVLHDVVYNHLGPEGNYLGEFGYYFTDRSHTPWGPAINVAHDHCDEVRAFFLENARMWQTEYHLDGLRLDAVQTIKDDSATPFLAELSDTVARQARHLNRPFYLIAETSANDVRNIRPTTACGFGMDALWNDDFHHSLRALLTDDRNGYYQDFGTVALHARAWREGFAFQGEYYRYRGCRHGSRPVGALASNFVVYSQNHDQVGNRAWSNRLIEETGLEGAKVAAASVLLSPFVPMLFMGEEYAESAPFPFFVDHGDPHLSEATRHGRAKEYAEFLAAHEMPDPQSPATFASARLDHARKASSPHHEMLAFYKELLRLRREVAFADGRWDWQEVLAFETERVLFVRRRSEGDAIWLALSFNVTPVTVTLPLPGGRWARLLDSRDVAYAGPGATTPATIESAGGVTLSLPPLSAVVYRRESGTLP